MTIREYGSRTAATNFLRGKGIAAVDFAKFLSAKGDKFLVNDALIGTPKANPVKEVVATSDATETAAKVKLPLETNVVVASWTDGFPPPTVSAGAGKSTAKRAAAKPVRGSTGKVKADVKPKNIKVITPKDGKPLPISQRCLQLFQAGKDNAYVWGILQAEYGLDEDKAHYPAWYRSHFRRKGVLPTASAVAKGKK